MKSKTYLYLGIFVVLIAAAYFLTTDRGEKTTSYKLSEKKLFEIDSMKVDKIEIKDKNGDLILSKASGEWKIESPFQYRTVQSGAEAIVSGLKNHKLESIVSSNPAKKETYGFSNDEQAEVTVYEAGNAKGKFLLGKLASGGSSYIKRPDNDNVYIAEGIDRGAFIKSTLDEWRDKNILSIPKESINSIEFISPEESFTVKREATGKYTIGADSTGKTFDGILNLLQKFDTNGFKDTTLAENTTFTETVVIDNGNKTELKFLKLDTTPPKYLLKVSGDNQIYTLDEPYAKNLLKTKKEILAN